MEIVFALIVIVAVVFVFVLFKNTKAGYERQIDELKKQLETEREYAKRMLDQADDNLQRANQNLDRERQHAEDLRRESDQRWEQKLESLKKDMQNTAAKELAAKQEELQRANRTQMDDLLRPIKEQFTDFKRAVDESKTQNEVNKTELQKAFENTMKLFQQQQQQTVDSLKQQTERIGENAANLSRALKGESKTQGDWGEMVLETLLENSGLQRDEEFFVQETVKSEDGATFRPDVVVRFPEGRSVVIDSKVSLTAYADAVATDDEHERDRLLAEHAKSVRRHVDELSAKSYDKLVEDAIGFVLMFVPNENSYIAAMKQQPDLSRYAYQKRIIIISPSNLLMALQLAYNLWQYDRQSKNVEKIVKTAADLYDKVAGFTETFTDLEGQLQRLARNFEQARGQLFDGKGNVLRRIDGLRALGVTPKKRIKGLEEEGL
ncbi:DNA recombination protein RmuC [Prevotella sp. oral taxon 317]|jgi:rmuC domain protein|uniref:DNA recombination protein RmuC n=1 Tax=Prevotella sp. oral taxon 317 TaxID=652721 RepID=UPI0001C3F640|nr:DNA recombination protein RmuC [Prevotella sp. oral taxon 317]EFC67745.1 RmuC domain protein [Prevotella sp. oral taxon 317 str. F0108]